MYGEESCRHRAAWWNTSISSAAAKKSRNGELANELHCIMIRSLIAAAKLCTPNAFKPFAFCLCTQAARRQSCSGGAGGAGRHLLRGPLAERGRCYNDCYEMALLGPFVNCCAAQWAHCGSKLNR